MASFLVEWSIDIEAETPQEAAEIARQYQVNPDTTAVVFTVHKNHGGVGGQYQRWHIDLADKKAFHREFPKRVAKRMAL